MPAEKENIKNELDAIKKNIEKKLANKENEISEIEIKNPKKETPKKGVTKKKKRKKVAPLITKIEVEKVVKDKTSKEETKPKKETAIKKSKKVIAPTAKLKRKKSTKKKKLGLIPIAIIILLIGSLAFIYSLKKDLNVNKKEFEEQSRKEKIDYSEDRYFKEVPDEVEEDDLQDFAVYKDVPEVIVDNNITNNQHNISSDEQKNIDKQINNSVQSFSNNTNNINDSENTINNNYVTENTTTNTTAENTTAEEQVNNTEKKEETFKKNKIAIIDSDYVKIIGLQHKDDKFTLPKKAKKINSFKVRTRLNKSILSDTPKDIEVMLVVKNSIGKTLKIDTKTINFEKSKSKIIYLEFYEIFNEKLKIDTEYSFSIFVDKKLIKISKTRI